MGKEIDQVKGNNLTASDTAKKIFSTDRRKEIGPLSTLLLKDEIPP